MLLQLFCLLALINLGWGFGTPRNIKTIFQDSCETVYSPQRCEEKLGLFLKAFSDKKPTEVTAANYDAFIGNDVNDKQYPVLLHTGTSSAIARRIEDTDGVYTSFRMKAVQIVDQFKAKNDGNVVYWCGRVGEGGINYELNADCETTKAYKSFWASVSVHIARSVPGEIVFWLASGDRPFDNNARFTKHEIPNLPQKVSELVVIILCNGEPNSQRCDDFVGPLRQRVYEVASQISQISCYHLRAERDNRKWRGPGKVAGRVVDLIKKINNGETVQENEQCN